MSARPMFAVGYTPVQHPERESACPDSLTLAASDLGLEEFHQPPSDQSMPLSGPEQRGLQELRPIFLSLVNHGARMELSSSKPAKTPNDSQDFQSHIHELEQM